MQLTFSGEQMLLVVARAARPPYELPCATFIKGVTSQVLIHIALMRHGWGAALYTT